MFLMQRFSDVGFDRKLNTVYLCYSLVRLLYIAAKLTLLIVSLVYLKCLDLYECLQACTNVVFFSEYHDVWLICFNAGNEDQIAKYTTLHLQQSEDNEKPVGKFTNTTWPRQNSLKEFFCSERRHSSLNCSFTVYFEHSLPASFCNLL